MKPEIAYSVYEEAEKMEIVFGIISAVSEVPKSDKLLKLSVDFGKEYGIKSILSGIKKETENIEDFVGKGAFFALNLAPRKIMGILSEGIICPFNMPDHPFLLARGNDGELPKGLKLF